MTRSRPGMVRLTIPGVEALVSLRAAALRAFRVDGLDLVEPTLDAAHPPAMAGAVLAPWPNRVEGARWWHAGRELRLEVTEPDLGHANHGLLGAVEFRVERATSSTVVLGAPIRDAPGYPFDLEMRVRYRLDRKRLAVRFAIRNHGSTPAPVAFGAHPYLRLGDTPTADLLLHVDADTAYRLDDAHIPRERFPVDDGPWDLRRGRPVPEAPAHATFAHRGRARRLRHLLVAPDGRAVQLWTAPAFRWTQLYRATGFPADDGPRDAIAVEPMTAPPNGLRTGEGIRMLRPGRFWAASFSIGLRQGSSRVR